MGKNTRPKAYMISAIRTQQIKPYIMPLSEGCRYERTPTPCIDDSNAIY